MNPSRQVRKHRDTLQLVVLALLSVGIALTLFSIGWRWWHSEGVKQQVFAGTLLDELEDDWTYTNTHVAPEELLQTIKRKGLSAEEIRVGAIRLLEHGSPRAKARAALFLGKLGDASAIPRLVEAAKDPDPDVRVAFCHALIALCHRRVSISAAEETLIRLRADDPALEVRLAAATTLQRPNDPASIAVFKAGLASTSPWIRSECEDQLDELGQLELPLAESSYQRIGYDLYKQRKFGSWRDKILRETRKNGKLYFEYEFRSAHGPWLREWFVTNEPAEVSKDKQ
jgi:hypothetical protein